MEFMLLIVSCKGAAAGEPVAMAEMGKFAGELARLGKLRGGAPLDRETSGVRVRLRDGRAVVTDGPFAETKESVWGYYIVEAASRDEAIDLARRCPHTRRGPVEVRSLPDRDVGTHRPGTKFIFLLWMAPDLADPEGTNYRQMVAYDEALKREGAYIESSQLGLDPPAARVETAEGKPFVTDGPFVETKEITGGYYVVEAVDRTAAVELAKRCPHAKWGTVEVREILEVGPA
jgi:hypothetical protein